MKTVITLGDTQAKGMRMLEVACRKCAPPASSLSMAARTIYDRCGMHFPELPKWF